MSIDAHVHFWKYNSLRHQWITEEMSVLRNNFLPDNLQPLLKSSAINGCVAVQADQSEEETEFLISLSRHHNYIKGVVGWVDISSARLSERLEYFSNFQQLKGFRNIVQAEPDDFLFRKEFIKGISKLSNYNFTYDILIYARQLPMAEAFVENFPNQKFVIDHLAKPEIRSNHFLDWKKNIEKLAEHPNVYCKLSGMVTEANWHSWTVVDFVPYLDTVLNSFGASRLMYGSDWPVCQLAATYKSQLSIVEEYLKQLSKSEKKSIMGDTAIEFYSLH